MAVVQTFSQAFPNVDDGPLRKKSRPTLEVPPRPLVPGQHTSVAWKQEPQLVSDLQPVVSRDNADDDSYDEDCDTCAPPTATMTVHPMHAAHVDRKILLSGDVPGRHISSMLPSPAAWGFTLSPRRPSEIHSHTNAASSSEAISTKPTRADVKREPSATPPQPAPQTPQSVSSQEQHVPTGQADSRGAHANAAAEGDPLASFWSKAALRNASSPAYVPGRDDTFPGATDRDLRWSEVGYSGTPASPFGLPVPFTPPIGAGASWGTNNMFLPPPSPVWPPRENAFPREGAASPFDSSGFSVPSRYPNSRGQTPIDGPPTHAWPPMMHPSTPGMFHSAGHYGYDFSVGASPLGVTPQFPAPPMRYRQTAGQEPAAAEAQHESGDEGEQHSEEEGDEGHADAEDEAEVEAAASTLQSVSSGVRRGRGRGRARRASPVDDEDWDDPPRPAKARGRGRGRGSKRKSSGNGETTRRSSARGAVASGPKLAVKAKNQTIKESTLEILRVIRDVGPQHLCHLRTQIDHRRLYEIVNVLEVTPLVSFTKSGHTSCDRVVHYKGDVEAEISPDMEADRKNECRSMGILARKIISVLQKSNKPLDRRVLAAQTRDKFQRVCSVVGVLTAIGVTENEEADSEKVRSRLCRDWTTRVADQLVREYAARRNGDVSVIGIAPSSDAPPAASEASAPADMSRSTSPSADGAARPAPASGASSGSAVGAGAAHLGAMEALVLLSSPKS